MLTLIVILFAAQSVLQDMVNFITPLLTDGFAELSRREQRIALRTGFPGGILQFLKVNMFSKTAIFLGVPVLTAYLIVSFRDIAAGIRPRLNIAIAAVSVIIFGIWIVRVWLRDSHLVFLPTPLDYALFPVGLAITLLLTQRHFGNFIVGFSVFWIFYLFLRGYIPAAIPVFGDGASKDSFFQNYNFMTQAFWVDTGGIFGAPLQVVSRNVLVFIVFGAVLMASGGGGLLMKIANILTGRFTGGAAHAAVAASAMFGTISGAALSNVVSTGVMTIPVIKRAGFKPAFSGAVEAAASTGGQVVPPVMGVVAFFVAAQIGLDYRYIMLAAVTPALLYYFGVFLTVYFEARRENIGSLPASAMPRLTRREKWQTLVFIIPLLVLTFFLITQPSISRAGFFGIVAALICAPVLFPEFRSWHKIYGSFSTAGIMSAQILIIVAMIGVIIGLLSISGFNGRLALFLTDLASGPLLFVMVVVALGAIVLGMGLPPGATYFVIVIALSSGIDTVALAPLTLHLFVVFFAVMSTVTPPVALAAFAAAPIAGADPIKTGWQASRLALGGFIIPFLFIYHPAVLYKLQVVFEWAEGSPITHRAMSDGSGIPLVAQVTWGGYGWAVLAYCLAMWMFASALAGFEKIKLSIPARSARLVAGLLLLFPHVPIAAAGLAGSLGLIAWHRLAAAGADNKRKTKT